MFLFSFDRFLEHMQLILSSSVTTIMAQAKRFCTHLAPISRYLNGRNTHCIITEIPTVMLSGSWGGLELGDGTGAAAVTLPYLDARKAGSVLHGYSTRTALRVPPWALQTALSRALGSREG